MHSYGKLFIYAVAFYTAAAVVYLVGGSVPWHEARVFSIAIGWILEAIAYICGIASVVKAVQSIRVRMSATTEDKANE
jgi:hypothetical protein